MFKKSLNSFFKWYERHYFLNISIAAGLFILQLVHLYWLGTDVIAFKLSGEKYFPVSDFWQTILIFVDYTEIPALIAASLIYFDELRKKFNFKSALFIFLLLSQFLHIFWITDEFVVNQFTGTIRESILPAWLAWVAILIDYGEVPVIIDTVKKVFEALRERNFGKAAAAIKKRE